MSPEEFYRPGAPATFGKAAARKRRRGFALVLTLGFVVLLTVIILAFFSNSLLQRQVADSSASQTKSNLFAQGALDDVVGDLKQEIVDGSTSTSVVTGAVTSTIYTPASAATMVPYRAGSDPSWTNLIKRSAHGVASYPSGNGYAQSGPSRAANSPTTQTSLNGRYYTLARWNDALLLPPTSASDFTPNTTTAFTAPDWILVAQDGSNPTTWNANMTASPNSTTTVVGRYAYCIYDEGGLLDMNVAGYPSAPADAQQPYKNAQAYADLTQLTDASNNPYLTQAQITQMVNWRNAASLQQTPPAGLTAYASYVLANPTGFLKTSNTSLTGGQSDRMFASREQLIDFFNNNLGGGLAVDSALQYLTTFSRDISQPSFAPNPNRPRVLAVSAGGNNATGLDDQVNPSFLTVRATGTFTRNDGTTAIVGEPLVKKRFALNRLAWLTYLGPSASRTMTDADLVQLQSDGMTQAWLKLGTAQNIQNYFGLVWDSTNHRWNYNVHNGAGSGTGAIMKLADIAALGATARDPDFFELLKAGVNVGSIAKPITDSTGGGNQSYANQYYSDYDVDQSIVQLGVNIISQADVTGYPPRIVFNDGSGGVSNYGGLAGSQEYRGVKNLPYLYRSRSALIVLDAPTMAPPSPPAPAPYTGSGSYGDADQAPISDTGIGAYMKFPEIWNPHDYNSGNINETMGVVGPQSFQIYAETDDAVTGLPVTDCGVVAQASKNNGAYSSPFAKTDQSPGAYPNYIKDASGPLWSGEQRGMNSGNTVMTFHILRTAAGTALFREPTILFQPNYPTGSQLFSTPLNAPSQANLDLIAPYSSPAVPPIGFFATGGGFASGVTADDGTGLPTKKNGYIGFYVGCIPMQWIDLSQTRCPALTLYNFGNNNTVINYYLQYRDTSLNAWITYDKKQGTYDFINGLMQTPEAGFIHPDYLFGHREEVVDPRTSRFNFIQCHTQSGYPRYYAPPFSAAVANTSSETGWLNMAEGVVLSDRNGTSYGTVASVYSNFATSALGWYPGGWSQGDSPTGFRPGAYSQNNPDVTSADQNISDQTGGDNGMPSGADVAQYYADPDGVVRRAMAGYSNLATHSASGASTSVSTPPLYGFPMATANNNGTTRPSSPTQGDSRPMILNRPFRSVSELGYVFSGTPWKNLDFFTPESGEAALLDVFCIQDTDNPNALVAGKVNLNTRQIPVLQAIVAGAYKDEQNSGTGTVAGGASSLAQQVVQQLVTRTTDVTTKASGGTLVNGPLQNIGELVGKWVQQKNAAGGGIDGSQSYSGFTADLSSVLTSGSNDYNVQRFREAALRSLSASGQTRVWNLMIDLVAQVGRYPRTASALPSFNVEGEQRYWVHIAIDRLTGQVLDKQIEIIKE
jgi:hypothetical protein